MAGDSYENNDEVISLTRIQELFLLCLLTRSGTEFTARDLWRRISKNNESNEKLSRFSSLNFLNKLVEEQFVEKRKDKIINKTVYYAELGEDELEEIAKLFSKNARNNK
jgi:DNA-binding PadR family transcriptional regulator